MMPRVCEHFITLISLSSITIMITLSQKPVHMKTELDTLHWEIGEYEYA